MKSIKKIIIPAVLALFVIIQFFGVTPNVSVVPSENSIEKHYSVPSEVQQILTASCYDCHSNNTVYPWYSKVQPVKWWLASHINDGKRHLNFDEFNTYSNDKKLHKLDEITETVKAGEMPLKSYTLIHTGAKLSEKQKQQIIGWAKSVKESFNEKNPEQ